MEVTPLTDEQQQIVEQNLPLIYYVAREYRHVPDHVYDSIISRLHYRLCVCAQRFDPQKKTKISSYIVGSLKGEIKNYFRDESWPIRPPRKLREMSFSSAVDRLGEEVSEAEKQGENPEVIASCALPIPLHTITGSGREEGDYDLDPASEENLEQEVTDRLGGQVLVREVFQSLQMEERIILALIIKHRPVDEIKKRFQLSRSEASRARRETQHKAQQLYLAALNGDSLTVSTGSAVVKQAIRKRFQPQNLNYLEIRKRVNEQPVSAEA